MDTIRNIANKNNYVIKTKTGPNVFEYLVYYITDQSKEALMYSIDTREEYELFYAAYIGIFQNNGDALIEWWNESTKEDRWLLKLTLILMGYTFTVETRIGDTDEQINISQGTSC